MEVIDMEMKRLLSLLIILMFAISAVPLAFAEDGSGMDNQAMVDDHGSGMDNQTTVDDQMDNAVSELPQDTPLDRCVQQLSDRFPRASEDRIQTACKRAGMVVMMARENVTAAPVLGPELARDRLRNASETAKTVMEKVREEYASARERYAAAKEKYQTARKKYNELRSDFSRAKDALKSCDGSTATECQAEHTGEGQGVPIERV